MSSRDRGEYAGRERQSRRRSVVRSSRRLHAVHGSGHESRGKSQSLHEPAMTVSRLRADQRLAKVPLVLVANPRCGQRRARADRLCQAHPARSMLDRLGRSRTRHGAAQIMTGIDINQSRIAAPRRNDRCRRGSVELMFTGPPSAKPWRPRKLKILAIGARSAAPDAGYSDAR